MSPTDTRAAIFSAHRARLRSIGYRMLGSMSEADDLVQEAWLKWRTVSPEKIRSPEAWLTTTMTRLCVNQLKSARVRRMLYLGPWLPEPLATADGERSPLGPDESAEMADSLSLALLVVLERLSPIERAVFVLREVFDYEFAEVAAAVGREEDNCRRILSRARAHIAAHRPRFDVPSEQRERVFEQFTRAASTGDCEALVATMADDVTFVSDGGGRARALPVPLVGAERVSRLIAGVIRRLVPAHRVFRRMSINGLPGLIGIEHGQVVQVLALGIAEGKVSHIYIVTNPAKLKMVAGALYQQT